MKLKSTVDEKERLFCGAAFEIFEDSLKDIEGAIKFLKLKGYEKFIICGHSTGAQKALYFGIEYVCQEEIIGYVFLGPGDDMNLFKEKFIDNFNKTLKTAKASYDSKMLFKIPEIGYLSSKRFYDLVKDNSVEGNLFNYKKELVHIKQISQPVLTVFGKDEQYALIPVDEENSKIARNFINKKSTTKIVPGDHSFRGGEKELIQEMSKWVKEII